MEEVEVGENGEGLEEPETAERSAKASSELGLEARSGRGRWANEVGRAVAGQGNRTKKTGGRAEARAGRPGRERWMK